MEKKIPQKKKKDWKKKKKKKKKHTGTPVFLCQVKMKFFNCNSVPIGVQIKYNASALRVSLSNANFHPSTKIQKYKNKKIKKRLWLLYS